MHYAKWSNGNDSLIQWVSFNREGEELDTEMISGAEATDRLRKAAEDPYIVDFITDEKSGIFGYIHSYGHDEAWDCDEETYSEYMAEC